MTFTARLNTCTLRSKACMVGVGLTEEGADEDVANESGDLNWPAARWVRCFFFVSKSLEGGARNVGSFGGGGGGIIGSGTFGGFMAGVRNGLTSVLRCCF
jgi:hypothetical protein